MGALPLSAVCDLHQDRNNLLNHMTRTVKYIQYCQNITLGNDLWSDLYQELFLHLSEMTPEKLLDIHQKGYLDFYCLRFLSNQFNSNRSPFYFMFKDRRMVSIHPITENEVEFDECEEDVDLDYDGLVEKKIEIIKRVVDQLHWYDRELFLYKMENNKSYNEMSKETGIARSSLIDSIIKVKKLIQEEFRKEGL